MANARFLYNNFIDSTVNITVSTQHAGVVTATKKDGTGSATMQITGAFSGSDETKYVVQIDNVAGGAEIGESTYKWSDDGGANWDASGVTTSASYATLNNAVTVKWTAGTGDDFVINDKWSFYGISRFNANKVYDWQRDSRWRSTVASSNTITIDLTASQTPTAVVLYDHNFTSVATLTLMASSGDVWASPAYSQVLTVAATKILYYITTTENYRYWRLGIEDNTNSDSYVEIGSMFLGEYTELVKNFMPGYSKNRVAKTSVNITPYGVENDYFYNWQEKFRLSFDKLADADVVSLEDMTDSLGYRSTGVLNRLYFNRDSSEASEFWMVSLRSLPRRNIFTGRTNIEIELTEVSRSV